MSSTLFKTYRFTQGAIAFSLLAHVAALLAMVLLLDPGLDMGTTVAERAQWVAANPWRWRLGRLPWQITAFSDVLLSLALVSYSHRLKRAKALAWLGMIVTLFSVVPDQWGEFVYVTSYLDLARATASENLPTYLAAEAWGLQLTGTWAAGGYSVMTIFWGWTAAAMTRGRNRLFGLMTGVVVLLFAVSVVANYFATNGASVDGGYPYFDVVFVFNALAFPMLLLWMVWLGGVVGAAQNQAVPAADRELHNFKAPRGVWLPVAARYVAGVRDTLRGLAPFLPMKSEITDVLYLNWKVPTVRVAPYLPAPLKAHDLDGTTWVSLLTYRHGHFGPSLLGPLRALCPSPAQSNWRFYLQDHGVVPKGTIYFFKTMLDSPVAALLSRLLADGLPSHVTGGFEHRREGAKLHVKISGEGGSAPDLLAEVSLLEGPLEREADVKYLVEQNAGVNVVWRRGVVIESKIDIPIPLENVVPARVDHLESDFLAPLVADAECLAFVVPSVAFRALGENVLGPLEP